MGRTKGSKNKPKQRTDNSAPLIQEKKPTTPKKSKTDGFIHGPCGEFWPAEAGRCPNCYT